jgi:transcription initiation factor IIE alpha subunit
MADGRWRTVDDIRRKVKASPDDIRTALVALGRKGHVTREESRDAEKTSMWRAVQREGVQ